MATIPVKWFTGSMAGAPSWGRSPGKLIEVLDACLINGFNQRTLDSLVVSGGVATATRSLGHGYITNQVIEISGASPAGLNGEWRVTSVPTTATFTFACPAVSDGAASGTITAKTAPAGWTKEFSGTNVGVYRSPNILSPRSFYKIDDTYTTGSNGHVARLKCFAEMSDIDTGIGLWSTEDDSAGFYAPYTANKWEIYADDRTVYILNWGEYYSGIGVPVVRNNYFGDYRSVDPNDMDAEFMATGNANCYMSTFWSANIATSSYYQRRLRKDQNGAFGGHHTGYRNYHDYSGSGGASFPSPVDGGMMMAPAFLREVQYGTHLRGTARGAYWLLANQPFTFANYDGGKDISGVAGLEGRVIRIMPTYNYVTGSTYYIGRQAYDITGPWD